MQQILPEPFYIFLFVYVEFFLGEDQLARQRSFQPSVPQAVRQAALSRIIGLHRLIPTLVQTEKIPPIILIDRILPSVRFGDRLPDTRYPLLPEAGDPFLTQAVADHFYQQQPQVLSAETPGG